MLALPFETFRTDHGPRPQNFVVGDTHHPGADQFPYVVSRSLTAAWAGPPQRFQERCQRHPATNATHSLQTASLHSHCYCYACCCLAAGARRRTLTLARIRGDTGDALRWNSNAGPGGEPLGDTRELFRPGGSLHSFEHAGKRVLGGCRGVRSYSTRYACTPLKGTQLTGTQLTLTQRNGTRYATDATLTQRVPDRGTNCC